MKSRRSRKMGPSKVDKADQLINEDLDGIPCTDALRNAIWFSEMLVPESANFGSSKDDPALMDWDNELVGWVKDHGGMERPIIISMGAGPWSHPRTLRCPVCGGDGVRLDCGPRDRTYCGYCDRYGGDTIKSRAQIARTTQQLIRIRSQSRPNRKKREP